MAEVQVGHKILFEKASSKLDHHSDEVLDKVIAIIKSAPEVHHIRIEGYTSSEGILAKNKALSQARAESVMKYMIDHGVDKAMLSAKGFGPDNPVAPNDTEENREKNRRVFFNVLEEKEMEAPPPPKGPPPPKPPPPPPPKH
jgi:OOP family OmpA-OmpF porin